MWDLSISYRLSRSGMVSPKGLFMSEGEYQGNDHFIYHEYKVEHPPLLTGRCGRRVSTVM